MLKNKLLSIEETKKNVKNFEMSELLMKRALIASAIKLFETGELPEQYKNDPRIPEFIVEHRKRLKILDAEIECREAFGEKKTQEIRIGMKPARVSMIPKIGG